MPKPATREQREIVRKALAAFRDTIAATPREERAFQDALLLKLVTPEEADAIKAFHAVPAEHRRPLLTWIRTHQRDPAYLRKLTKRLQRLGVGS